MNDDNISGANNKKLTKKTKNDVWKNLDKNFDEAIFSCDSVDDKNELIKFLKAHPKAYYSDTMVCAIFIFIAIVLLSHSVLQNVFYILGAIVFSILIALLFHNYIFERLFLVNYPSFYKREIGKVFFYDTFLLLKNDEQIIKHNYIDLIRLIETCDFVYIIFSKKNELKILPKVNFNEESIKFIRNINPSIYYYIEDLGIKNKKKSKTKAKKQINLGK